MNQIRLSGAARRDLTQIRSYTSQIWGLAQWHTYFRGLTSALEAIAQNPDTGVPRDIIRKGLRSLTYESHLIFFRPAQHAGGKVVILRILHQRQNQAALSFLKDLE